MNRRRLSLLALLPPAAFAVQDLPPGGAEIVPPSTAVPLPAVAQPAASAERLAADVAWLTGYGTRHSLSAQNVEAAKAIRDRLAALGYTTELEEFSIGPTTRFNVVATKAGATRPDELVILGAHFDSRNKEGRDARGPAPGADDNATGTAAVLEVARQLAATPLDRTVRFVLFSGEEQGLVGARAHANGLKAAGANVTLMVNLDMVGHSSPPGPGGDAPPPTFPAVTAAPDAAGTLRSVYVESATVRGNGGRLRPAARRDVSEAWGDRLETLVMGYGLGVSRGPLYATDYIAFEAAGFPAVGMYDGADTEPFYHNAADLPAVVDPDYHARVASAALDLVRAAATAD